MKPNEKEQKQPLRLYSMKEFEKLSGVSRWKIYELIKEGKIKPVVNMGKGFKFTGDELKPEMLERL